MIITCPNCNKQFKIDASKIPEKGRNLQCGSCVHVWFYKIEDENLAPLTLNEDLASNETEINIDEKDIVEPVKAKQSITDNNLEDKEKKSKKILEKQRSLKSQKNKESKDGKFFSNLAVVIISFVALIILIDTFKNPLMNIFPGLEIILFNLFETLKDIKLFIIDLS